MRGEGDGKMSILKARQSTVGCVRYKSTYKANKGRGANVSGRDEGA